MTRQIKFRAWHEHGRRMVYGPSDDVISPSWVLAMCSANNIEPIQYTCLKDKKGNEIYEGDIVRQEYHKITGPYDDPETFSGHHIGAVVIIASKGVCMRNPLCYADETTDTERTNQYKTVAGYRCEIIGNIYENPELSEE